MRICILRNYAYDFCHIHIYGFMMLKQFVIIHEIDECLLFIPQRTEVLSCLYHPYRG